MNYEIAIEPDDPSTHIYRETGGGIRILTRPLGALLVLILMLAGCVSLHPPACPDPSNPKCLPPPPSPIGMDSSTTTAVPATLPGIAASGTGTPSVGTPAPVVATPAPPAAALLLRLQDRLNFFASAKYQADVASAKVAGADALQIACMDATIAIGADIKATPLISLPSTDLGPVDRSCGWCVLAAKRKQDAARLNGPSLLTQIADANKRVGLLARKGLVACAPLKEDIRLSLLNPENAATDLLDLVELVNGQATSTVGH